MVYALAVEMRRVLCLTYALNIAIQTVRRALGLFSLVCGKALSKGIRVYPAWGSAFAGVSSPCGDVCGATQVLFLWVASLKSYSAHGAMVRLPP